MLVLTTSGDIRTIGYSPDGACMLAWVDGGRKAARVRRWNLTTGRELRPTRLHGDPIQVVIASRSDVIAYLTSTGVYFIRSNDEVFGAHDSGSSPRDAIAITPDASLLALSGSTVERFHHRSVIEVIRPEQPLTPYRRFSSSVAVRTLALSNDGRFLASGGDDGMTIWDVQSGESIAAFPTVNVTQFAFAPAMLAVAAGEFVHLWDLARIEQTRSLVGHLDRVTCLAVSPDGKTLITGSRDRTVKTWSLADGRLLQTYSWPTGPVNAVAYAPDGLTAAAGGESGDIVVWDVDD